jgi:acetyl-CoA carboxylase carboxyl transferase subunit beta
MAIEDLFKIVKERFVADQPAAPANSGGDVEIPQDLLFKCPRCGAVVYNREFTAAMKVCPKCNYHARLTWQERLELTADKESFQEFDADMKSLNPIGFPKYEDKIAKMQQQCDMNDAIKTGVCTIRGYRTVIGIMDSHFFMASMGSVVGEKIARAFEYATEHNLPVVMFTASGGQQKHGT